VAGFTSLAKWLSLASGSPLQEGGFQYWFSKSVPPGHKSFGAEVAALDFATELPWVLEASDAPTANAQMKIAEDVMKRL
jgi:hypothetical protein